MVAFYPPNIVIAVFRYFHGIAVRLVKKCYAIWRIGYPMAVNAAARVLGSEVVTYFTAHGCVFRIHGQGGCWFLPESNGYGIFAYTLIVEFYPDKFLGTIPSTLSYTGVYIFQI